MSIFSHIYIQIVFALEEREPLIHSSWEERLYQYIMNQKGHHKKQIFRDEYIVFLKKFGIKYDEKYLFAEK